MLPSIQLQSVRRQLALQLYAITVFYASQATASYKRMPALSRSSCYLPTDDICTTFTTRRMRDWSTLERHGIEKRQTVIHSRHFGTVLRQLAVENGATVT